MNLQKAANDLQYDLVKKLLMDGLKQLGYQARARAAMESESGS